MSPYVQQLLHPERQALVARGGASGLDMYQFAKQHGVPLTSLRCWQATYTETPFARVELIKPPRTPETLVSYATRAKGVLAAVGDQPLTDLGLAFMERLRDSRVAAGLTQRGVHARQRLLRSAARWAAAEERLTHKPLPVVRLRSAERVNLDCTP